MGCAAVRKVVCRRGSCPIQGYCLGMKKRLPDREATIIIVVDRWTRGAAVGEKRQGRHTLITRTSTRQSHSRVEHCRAHHVFGAALPCRYLPPASSSPAHSQLRNRCGVFIAAAALLLLLTLSMPCCCAIAISGCVVQVLM
jgi:hypothetical protein